MKQTIHLHLPPRLRMSGAIPLFPFTPSWPGQRQPYLYRHFYVFLFLTVRLRLSSRGSPRVTELHFEMFHARPCLFYGDLSFNPLNPELNPICYLLALLGAHHFLHVSRIRVKSLTFRLLTSHIYIYIYIYIYI